MDQDYRSEPRDAGAGARYGGMQGSEVGGALRDGRLRAGYELGEVAAALNIRRQHLEAIEEGRFGDLPGPTYAVGFLRSYALYLGLDGDAAVRLFKDEVRGFGTSTKLVFPAPTSEGKRPTGTVVVVSLLMAAAIYGSWRYFAADGRVELEAVSEIPERLVPVLVATDSEAPPEDAVVAAEVSEEETTLPAPGQMQSTPDRAASSAEEPAQPPAGGESEAALGGLAPAAGPATAAAPAAEAPPARVEVAAAEPSRDARAAPARRSLPAIVDTAEAATPPQPVAEPAADFAPPPTLLSREEIAATMPRAVAGAPAPDATADGYVPQLYGAANKEARVVLRARMDSWVQIRGDKDELVLTRMLRAGDSYRVPDRGDLVMMTGNAGAIQITVDGKTIPPVGPVGAVMRDVSLDAERLLKRDVAHR